MFDKVFPHSIDLPLEHKKVATACCIVANTRCGLSAKPSVLPVRTRSMSVVHDHIPHVGCCMHDVGSIYHNPCTA